MKAIHAYNKRGTVHEWSETAVGGYYQRRCDRKQLHLNHLQTTERDRKGMPVCKRCFPADVGDQHGGT